MRGGDLGYLPQDPGSPDLDPTLTASRTCCPAAASTAPDRLEKLRLAMEEAPIRRATSRASRGPRSRSGTTVGTGGLRGAAHRGRARGGADRMDRPVRVLSGGERRRMELARILFAGSDLLLLDEPTNHLDTDAKSWLMKFLGDYRGGLLVVSHDLDAPGRSDHAVLHLDDGGARRVPRHVLAVPEARRQDELRLTKIASARSRRSGGCRPGRLDAPPDREARAQGEALDTRVEQMKATGRRRRRSARPSVPVPRRRRTAAAGLVVEGLTKGYGGPPVFTDVSFDARSRRTAPDPRAERRRQDVAAAHPGRGVRARRGDVPARHRRVGRLLRAGARGHRSRCEVIRTCARSSVAERRPAAADRHVRPDRRARVPGRRNAVGRREDEARPGAAGGRAPQPPLLDEPTNNLDPPSREAIAKALGDWPGTMVIVSHDEEFVHALDPDRVLFMPEGRSTTGARTCSSWSRWRSPLIATARPADVPHMGPRFGFLTRGLALAFALAGLGSASRSSTPAIR